MRLLGRTVTSFEPAFSEEKSAINSTITKLPPIFLTTAGHQAESLEAIGSLDNSWSTGGSPGDELINTSTSSPWTGSRTVPGSFGGRRNEEGGRVNSTRAFEWEESNSVTLSSSKDFNPLMTPG
ncbi:unnamed protein product [Schistosoma curassoni]|uniref:Uncharacterized protein n=1 Tax=Schistosoma curassoni TaxID=6186 RepID=A0A183KMK6_9TREM|nr:unnamed protein product [Schistosoma curassoni]